MISLSSILPGTTSADRVALIAAIIEWDPYTLERAIELETQSTEAALVVASIRDTSIVARLRSLPDDPSQVTVTLDATQRAALHAVHRPTAAEALLTILDAHIAQAVPNRDKPAPNTPEIPPAEKAACAHREHKFRLQVYANKAGGADKITPYFLRQIAVMAAIAADYDALAAAATVPAEPTQVDLFANIP